MTFLQNQFFGVFLFLLFSIFLACFILFLSLRLGAYNPDTEKVSAYECGFDPYEDSRNAFEVKFYLLAIIFILFDLEAAFFYPWSLAFSFLNIGAFWGMFDFIFELLVGFAYVWVVGGLEW
jgi:NADH-quinone oxidoreductase subunit A